MRYSTASSLQHVAASVSGKIVKEATDAESPCGGKVMEAVVAADQENGKFPIKDKDTAMAAAFAFLREKVRRSHGSGSNLVPTAGITMATRTFKRQGMRDAAGLGSKH